MRFKQAYEQKRDLGHITLKIVAHDEQKRDLGYITLKNVTGGWRTAGNDESNEESSAENVRGRCEGLAARGEEQKAAEMLFAGC